MGADEQLVRIARKLVWWEDPSIALSRPARFLMQVMTLGTWQDVQTVRRAYGEEALREALLHAEPGVFDPRSWAYWHGVFGLAERPLPLRTFA